MKDVEKTKSQLIEGLTELRQRVAELEAAPVGRAPGRETLREREERLELALEAVSDGVWDWNVQTGQVYFSPRYYTMLGYEPYEMPPSVDTWIGLMHPEDGENALGKIYKQLQTMDEGYEVEFRMRTKTGGWRWILDRGRVVERSDIGLPARVVGVHIDITERKQSEQEIRQHTAQLEALREVGLELTAQLELDGLLQSIVSRAAELLGAVEGNLYLYQPDQDVLRGVAGVGDVSEPASKTFRRGEGLCGKVWEMGEPLVIDDYRRWEGRVAVWASHPAAAAVGVPVRWGQAGVEDQLLGVLLVRALPPRTFSPTDSRLLSLFATQAAIAIRNARSYEAERKRATQLAVINQVARKAVSILDPDQLLQEVAADIQRGFAYYNVVLLQLDETTGELGQQAIAGGFADMAPPDYRQAVGEGLIGWAAQTGQSLLVNDVSEEPRYIVGFEEEVPTRSEMCVPLELADRVIGVLDVQETRPNAFDETDLLAMEIMADQVAVALQNARLYRELERELFERGQVERALQASLLEKEVLLQEIHHRVKNNLAVISSLLSLQSEALQDEQIRAAFQESHNRIHSMVRVHEQLYQSKDLARVDMAPYIRGLGNYLRRSFGAHGVAITVDAQEVALTIDTAIPCGLIINELVSNALKHAFVTKKERPSGQVDEIHISLCLDAGRCKLTVRDNGSGLPAGVDVENPESLGLRLVNLLTQQIGSTLQVLSHPGTTFQLTFPGDKEHIESLRSS
jgi:PAS domain S-box-containing protein